MGGENDPAGNFLGEWFGFRVWPPDLVDDSDEARRHQAGRLCPFISAATRQETACIKARKKGEEPTGVCTISSDSNTLREDWLACPFRLLDRNFTLLEQAVRTVYRVIDSEPVSLYPITVLNKPDQRDEIVYLLRATSNRVFLFTANKLGGEVNIPETDSSPGSKVDFTVLEALLAAPETPSSPNTGRRRGGRQRSPQASKTSFPLDFGKVMMFEVQAADFHGSPTHAVEFLKDVCTSGHDQPYHERIRQHPEKVGHKVEGPNKSNIFKRTIYQMLLEMELARDSNCSGFVIVLPLPVWTSWLRHLGRPALTPDSSDPTLLRLEIPQQPATTTDQGEQLVRPEPAWIFVFDIDRDSSQSPKPLVIIHRIATDAASLMHFAFEEAVTKATDAGVMGKYRTAFIGRVKTFWKRTSSENLVEEVGFVPDADDQETDADEVTE